MDAQTRREVAAALEDIYQVLTGTGEHADHEREQIGPCVLCSCGRRVQGQMQ